MQTQQAAVAQSQLLQQINAMTPTWMVDSFENDFCIQILVPFLPLFLW
jgi:hypothetical protein